MQLVMVHGSGQNELTYHYQTERFENADAVNLPGHPDGEPRDSIGGYVDWVRDHARGKGISALRPVRSLHGWRHRPGLCAAVP